MDISVLGLGNVGTKVLQIIKERNGDFRRKFGFAVNVVSVSDSKHTVYDQEGLDPGRILSFKEQGDISKSGYREIDREEILNLQSDAIIDLSPATRDGIFGRDLYISAFSRGKDVVTANKSPLALHWKAIMNSARDEGRLIRYESTVAGGVPLFNLRDFAIFPSDVTMFRGIVSSTVNVVLGRMLSGSSFEDALKYAQDAGIAEADYHDDTLGIDAARKTVIISNALFGTSLTLDKVPYEGVEGLEDTIQEMASTGAGYRIASIIRKDGSGISVRSGIEKLEGKDPLLVLGEDSLGYVMGTDYNGDLLVAGLHDGPMETASGVVNDIAILARLSSARRW